MALDGSKNFSKVTVSLGYDAVATSIVLTTGHGAKLPDPATANFNLTWFDSSNYGSPEDDPNVEVVRCTAKTTDTITVTRAQEGTSATTKNTGGATYKMILGVTAKMITDIDTLKANLASPTFSGTLTVPTGLTGVLRADSGVVSVDTDVTDIVGAASTTAAGKVEIAIGSEVDTGTDDVRAISPKALADQTVLLKSNKILRVFKTANETVNNSTTYQNDDHLFLSVEASSNYIIELLLMVVTDSTGKFKMQFTGPTGATLTNVELFYPTTASGTYANKSGGTVLTDILTANPQFNDAFVLLKGVFTTDTTAGTLTLQWAQSTANASNCLLAAGSYLSLIKI